MINYMTGNACLPVGKETKCIAHVCNDRGGWGKGFVLAIDQYLGLDPRNAYFAFMATYPFDPVGEVIFSRTKRTDIIVASMICQDGYRTAENPCPLNYDKLKACLFRVAYECSSRGMSLHMPKIGSGLAGGDWNIIQDIIQVECIQKGIQTTVYTLI